MIQAQELVAEFIRNNPKLANEATGLYELYEMEVNNGESEQNEFSLLSNSLEDLLIKD